MEEVSTNINASSNSYPMKGGDGPHSYSKNSSFQRESTSSAKEIINNEISQKLDIKQLSSASNIFRIADLGCSVGPNTFTAMQNIVEVVELTYRSGVLGSKIPDFQVFFSDHESNDFNTLFNSLPRDRKYFAAGVPGSFHGRLFPESSLHFVFSSYAVHWLSKVPTQVVDKNSPAWNKGRINYVDAPIEVVEAYSAQFDKDMDIFFHARAQELVHGGMMAIIMPCLPNEHSASRLNATKLLDILASSFMDLAKMGLFSEEKVDSFNIPSYFARPQDLEALVERNGCFIIERMEQVRLNSDAENDQNATTMHMRAALESTISEHFGIEILDQLFDLFNQKLHEPSNVLALSNPENYQVVMVLRRK